MSATYDDPSSVTVVVVDDHPIWREGVARDLAAQGFVVVATVADSSFTARIAAATQPRVVVIDLDLDELSAVKAGAAGYLVKSASAAELVDAVRRTANGDAVFTAGLADLVLGEYQRLAAEPEPEAASVPRLTG